MGPILTNEQNEWHEARIKRDRVPTGRGVSDTGPGTVSQGVRPSGAHDVEMIKGMVSWAAT